ncbi:MAG: hypothetical protein RIS29_3357, partial [Bacteroidota bacterium]
MLYNMYFCIVKQKQTIKHCSTTERVLYLYRQVSYTIK